METVLSPTIKANHLLSLHLKGEGVVGEGGESTFLSFVISHNRSGELLETLLCLVLRLISKINTIKI